MKEIFFKLLLLIVASFAAIDASAYTALIDGIAYDFNANTHEATVVSGGSYTGDITIPKTVTYNDETYSVTKIGNGAFYQWSSLTSVGDLSACTSIGSSAFSGCSSLTSVGDLSACTSIGSQAFYQCKNLTSVGDLSACTSIGGQAFYHCSSLTSVDLSACKSIGNNAFSECSNLTSVGDLSACTSIGDNAFQSCSSLSSVGDLSACTSIEANAFYQCSSLTSVDLSACKSIGNFAFSGCKNLTSIGDLSACTSIEYLAFNQCKNLTSIGDLSACKSIGNSAFNECSNLTSVGDLSSCTSIGDKTFYSCSKLMSVGDLSVCTSIGNYAFSGCSSLTSIGDLSACTSIGSQAFSSCSSLTSVGGLSACTSIGDNAFNKCPITEIILSDNIQTIGSNAFFGTYSIKLGKAEVPNLTGTSMIDNNCTIIVPAASLEAYRNAENWNNFYQQIIPDNAIMDYAVELTAKDNGSSLWTIGGEEQLSYTTKLTLSGSINGYDIMIIRNRMPNLHVLDMTNVTIVGNPYEYVTGCYTEDHRLGQNAFAELLNLVEVILPNSITYIGRGAFYGCSYLRKVTINEGAETIDAFAFCACNQLNEVIFPNGIKDIKSAAFYSCSNLREVIFGEGLLSLNSTNESYKSPSGAYSYSNIKGYAFCGCTSLKKTVFPKSTTIIGPYSFAKCSNLEEIVFPEQLRTIGYYAFQNCSSLKSITLPSYLSSIGDNALNGCTSLSEVRIPPMVEAIGSSAFAGCDNIKDIYVYLANAKDISIAQNTFNCYKSANLHIPTFAYDSYFWNTQWSQFTSISEFDEPYSSFYTKSTMRLDEQTGTIDGVPDATLYANSGLEVNGVTQELDNVELKSDGTNSGSIIAETENSVKVKQLDVTINVTKNKWHFFCFPFNVPLANITYVDGAESVWRQYDGAKRSRREGGWQDLAADATELIAGRGYIFQGTATGELKLTIENPEFTASDVTTNLEVYATSDTQASDASWNFIGNPYTSYYNVTEETYSAPITVWTGSGYEAYRPGDDDYEFAPYQAFFVQTPEDVDGVTFGADNRETYDEAQQTAASNRMKRARMKINPDRLLINIELAAQSDTTYLDKTRIVFNDQAAMSYEQNCDAAKFFSTERRAEIYSLDSEGTEYSINERPEDNGYIPLGFVANVKGKYSISAPRMDTPMILVDDVMETTHDLSLGEYDFSSAKGTFNKRFSLKRLEGVPTSIKELADKIGMTYDTTDGVTIDGIKDNTQVAIYNMGGQCMGRMNGNGHLSALPGAYVITVGKLSAKVIVK